jgi:NADPH:quinone reductase
MRAVRVDRFGEPDVLVIDNIADPEPATGQVLVDVRMAGVVYGDVIVRSGRYPLPLPWIPGVEVSGKVVAAGPGAGESLLGKTVVAATAGQAGGYAERALAAAAYTFPVPDGLALDVAPAVFQAGAVARGLLSAMRLRADDTVLITAAAGRIGSLLVQSAKSAGATVIGAASREKLTAVTEFGADHAVDYSAAGWPDQVRELTAGRGATLVLDAVGGETAASALAAAADGAGRIGLYGFASGEWPVLDAQTIGRRGLTVSGPLGMIFRKSDAEQRDDAEQALAATARGELTPRIHARFPLERAADAHRELEARRSVGAIVITCHLASSAHGIEAVRPEKAKTQRSLSQPRHPADFSEPGLARRRGQVVDRPPEPRHGSAPHSRDTGSRRRHQKMTPQLRRGKIQFSVNLAYPLAERARPANSAETGQLNLRQRAPGRWGRHALMVRSMLRHGLGRAAREQRVSCPSSGRGLARCSGRSRSFP